ncbi:glycosyltransferase 87 family protein [Pendulispora rubella]|uniref:Glycosyltransferase 87 family protein n=1 Tax=Pendulispora rubella TaxID=2741070 RepID=A0ABZ2L2S7_9BACT
MPQLPPSLAWFARHGWGLAVGGTVLLATLIALHPYTMPMRYPLLDMVDLRTYRDGGQAILSGTPLYTLASGGYKLAFVYTPFAALVFVPLAWVPWWLVDLLAPMAQLLLFAWTIWVALRALGHLDGRQLRYATLGLAAVFLFLEPVLLTLCFGQINIALMALILWDLGIARTPRWQRWQGAAVGIAAGIKLTPGIFIIYLLCTRRPRAAVVATLALAGTVALGFLVAPADSLQWWTGTFAHASRIGEYGTCVNQSLSGLVTRLTHESRPAQLPWLLLCLATAGVGLTTAAAVHRAGHTLLGITLCGLTGTMVSPFSWTHHWVWLVPLAIVALHHAEEFPRTTRRALFGAFAVCTLAWPIGFVTGRHMPDMFGLFAIGSWHGLELVYHNTFILLYAVVLTWGRRWSFRAQPSVPAPA